MQFTVVYEKINSTSFPENFYYAHIPSLGLTTHGEGIEGANEAAKDLIKLWIQEKVENGEEVKEESETFFSKIDV